MGTHLCLAAAADHPPPSTPKPEAPEPQVWIALEPLATLNGDNYAPQLPTDPEPEIC